MIRRLIVAFVAVAGACAGASTGGPLALDRDPLLVCTTARSGGGALLGNNVVTNSTDSVATIDDVTLTDALGVSLADVFVLPIEVVDGGFNAVGADTWPPTSTSDLVWSARVPAIGAEVAPGAVVDLVSHVVLDSTEGSTAGINVRYTVAGQRYEWQSASAYELRPVCQ